MHGIIDNPRVCLTVGLALAALLLIVSLVAGEADGWASLPFCCASRMCWPP